MDWFLSKTIAVSIRTEKIQRIRFCVRSDCRIVQMRELTEELEAEFVNLHGRVLRLIEEYSFEDLFSQVTGKESENPGMLLVRSAALVEQCFVGITTRLWDDPFEWTLRESFHNAEQVSAYFSEVEQARENGFAHFQSDADLRKHIPSPAGMHTVFAIVIRSLIEAENYLLLARDRIARGAEPSKVQ